MSSCAYVHHTQVGEVVSRPDHIAVPFEILVSERGFNFQETGLITKAFLRDSRAGRDAAALGGIIGLFQMGPRTGIPVYSGDDYADKVYFALYEKCPSGQITGITSIRETNRYPIVSGEIVKIRAFCLMEKTNKTGNKI